MASMGVNIQYWQKKGAPLFKCSRHGSMETEFLESLNISLADIEPKADNCTKVSRKFKMHVSSRKENFLLQFHYLVTLSSIHALVDAWKGQI